MKNSVVAIIISILLAAFVTIFLSAAVWIMGVWALCIFLIFQVVKSFEDRKIVFFTIIWALIVRFILVCLYGIVCHKMHTPDVLGDACAYSSYGIYLAEIFTGKPYPRFPVVSILWNSLMGDSPKMGEYQVNCIAYLQGIAFSVFGYSTLTIKLFNSLLGVMTGFVAYIFLRKKIGTRVAAISLFLILFYPSILVWSITGLKDTLLMFLSLLSMTAMPGLFTLGKKLKEKITPCVIILLCAIVSGLTRKGMMYFYLLVLTMTYIFIMLAERKILKKTFVALFLFASVLFLTNLGNVRSGFASIANKVIVYQKGQSTSKGKTFYKVYPDRFYKLVGPNKSFMPEGLSLGEVAVSFFKGTTYFFFSPFLTHLKISRHLIFVYVQALFSLFIFPLMIIGVNWSLRHQMRSFLPMFIFMTLSWAIGGLISGNIGTAFRHRDMIMPAYLIFAVIGFCKLFRLKDDLEDKGWK
ncbi:MAG: glycosyltransferase family 39 protein [Candidatus Omnitrophica bacterium]|nr:glycosyltransferase family 39 protein [Candidatus Omnitrophota bacterium]